MVLLLVGLRSVAAVDEQAGAGDIAGFGARDESD